MSQPASAKVLVRFNTPRQAFNAYVAFQTWEKQASSQSLPDPDANGDYCIEDIDRIVCDVICTVSSDRSDNCIWQCENIRDFFKKQEGCISFSADVMTCEDSVNWHRMEDEEEQLRRDEKNGLYGGQVDPAN